MNTFSIFKALFVLAVVAPATQVAAASQPQPTRLPVPLPTICPYVTSRTNADGVVERVYVPCKTPDPCVWPRPPYVTTHGAPPSRLTLPYPPPCCPILYRQLKLSERSLVPYPLPIPCKFTPLPRPTMKPECAPCRSNAECLQGKCWGSPLKCTDGDYYGLLECGFKKECDDCTSGLQCATMKCWKKKCVFNTKKSKVKCFGH